MKISLQFLLCLGVLICSFCSTQTVGQVHTNIDVEIDELLNIFHVDPLIHKYLGHIKLFPAKDFNGFELANAALSGLQNFKRNGQSTFDYANSTSRLSLPLKVENLVLSSNWGTKIVFHYKGDLEIQMEALMMDIVISYKKNKLTLDKFKVTRVGHFKVNKLTGASIMYSIISSKIEGKLNTDDTKHKIKEELEKRIPEEFNKLLAMLNSTGKTDKLRNAMAQATKAQATKAQSTKY